MFECSGPNEHQRRRWGWQRATRSEAASACAASPCVPDTVQYVAQQRQWSGLITQVERRGMRAGGYHSSSPQRPACRIDGAGTPYRFSESAVWNAVRCRGVLVALGRKIRRLDETRCLESNLLQQARYLAIGRLKPGQFKPSTFESAAAV